MIREQVPEDADNDRVQSDRDAKIKEEAESEFNSYVPHIFMSPETIEVAALQARKSSSGGLDQITPWLLRRAQ